MMALLLVQPVMVEIGRWVGIVIRYLDGFVSVKQNFN